ncbi:hypothetical protein [Parabacteroides sp.]
MQLPSPGAGRAGFTCSWFCREPAEADSRAAGFTGSQRRQIHMQPALPRASRTGFTCSYLRREPAGLAAHALSSAGSFA